MTRILIIKLSALGDFIQASGAMEAIARAHPDARLTLLTTPPFEALARAAGWFEEIWTDGRPAWRDLPAVARLIGRLRRAGFERVYDLQGQSRTDRYFQLLRPEPPAWCGTAWGAAFRHPQRLRQQRHIQDVLAEQLALAGVHDIPRPHLAWLQGDAARFELPARYALIAPGGAPHRPQKRWPAPAFGEIARRLAATGTAPVLLGRGAEEEALARAIQTVEPAAVSLVGRTGFADIASLARGAQLALGNDTGPMQVAAAAGAPSLVLFSADSDPAMSAPRPSRDGQVVETLQVRDLQALPPAAIVERLRAALGFGL
ncbi:glycosyltransferase family 9 protein [Phenylobacterium sp.]|jgi:ADP-heptose:LPS heptosyltransferase|uniref:glycosyltransferase family 9 protein n=1 Tax=Phenylobacterium sp. TaxID=1871053 RepID=UPI002F3EEEDC